MHDPDPLMMAIYAVLAFVLAANAGRVRCHCQIRGADQINGLEVRPGFPRKN